ncbi:MAG: nicotinamide mononucleotide transporter [Bacteroidetes bacterium]|nr:nicotinamide mononucleotide transporter [Bacteroidota bacterium]MBT4400958.1 nicotinamide mononucleotide transporter [Bacteroidota bacterium]
MKWIIENWVEVSGVVISLIYLFFSVRQKIWLWPFGLLSAVFYIYIYYSGKLYADMGLQFYYVIISIYGWILWKKKNETAGGSIRTRKAPLSLYLYLLFVFCLLLLLLFFGLTYLTDSDVPFWDALTTAGGIIGTWMLARKYIENWIVWIVVDSISIFLYLYKGLFATAVLFIIYTIIAFIGYQSWLKKIKQETL